LLPRRRPAVLRWDLPLGGLWRAAALLVPGQDEDAPRSRQGGDGQPHKRSSSEAPHLARIAQNPVERALSARIEANGSVHVHP
jgi:hypothetical protein